MKRPEHVERRGPTGGLGNTFSREEKRDRAKEKGPTPFACLDLQIFPLFPSRNLCLKLFERYRFSGKVARSIRGSVRGPSSRKSAKVTSLEASREFLPSRKLIR